LKKPENCFYYPKKHELIFAGRKESEYFVNIQGHLKQKESVWKAIYKPIWYEAVYILCKHPNFDCKFNDFWARNETGMVKIQKDKDVHFLLFLEDRIPAFSSSSLIYSEPIDPALSFFDFILSEEWQVDSKYPYYQKINNELEQRPVFKEKLKQKHSNDFFQSIQTEPVDVSEDIFELLKKNLLSIDHFQADFPVLEPEWLDDANRVMMNFSA
jgi:hypothetical protein